MNPSARKVSSFKFFLKAVEGAAILFLCIHSAATAADTPEIIGPTPTLTPPPERVSPPAPSLTLAPTAAPGEVPQKAGFHFGPRIALSLPTPLQIGLEGFWNPRFRFFIAQGFLLLPLRSGSLVFGTASVDFGMRFFPLNRWLSLGLAGGYRRLQVSADVSSVKVDGEKIANRITAILHTYQLSPTVGVSWQFHPQWELSADLGAQIPVFFTGGMTVEDTNGATETIGSGVVNPLSRIAGLFLPQVTLIRLTWLWK
jgi:hypothetical protein